MSYTVYIPKSTFHSSGPICGGSLNPWAFLCDRVFYEYATHNASGQPKEIHTIFLSFTVTSYSALSLYRAALLSPLHPAMPFIAAMGTIDPRLLEGDLVGLICSHVTSWLAPSQGRRTIMKSDWSERCPHTWQAGSQTPRRLFQTAPSLAAERRRHLNQSSTQVSRRALLESQFLQRDLKIKSLFVALLEQ